MPTGFLAKTQAEVALDLVAKYLEFAGEKEREKYQDAEAYLQLFEKAYRLILEISEKGKPSPGFQA